MMKIKINGNDETIDESELNISQLLVTKDVKMPDMVTVEYNGDIIDRSAFDSTMVHDGDEIEFLYFMGGGTY